MNTPIAREDIRKGDRVRETREYTVASALVVAGYPGYTYELIERPVTLPTAFGYYLDRQGDAWKLGGDGWVCLDDEAPEPKFFAPFTLLRPVAEVAAEVLLDVRNAHFTDDPTCWGKLDALTAKWATK